MNAYRARTRIPALIAFCMWATASHSDSLWNHNGSTVTLQAFGQTRRFYYEMPRAGVPAQRGALLFDGERRGRQYFGTSYLFSNKCGQIGYEVSGNVSADERNITLYGKAPIRDVNCKVSGTRDDVLVFALQNVDSAPNSTDGREISTKKKIIKDPSTSLSLAIQAWRETPLYSGEKSPDIWIDSCNYLVTDVSDDFLREFEDIARQNARLTTKLRSSGYPEHVWSEELAQLTRARLGETLKSEQRGTLSTSGSSDLREPVMAYERRLAAALESYRMTRNRSLPKAEIGPLCGGDWIGYARILTTPPGGVVRLIPEFHFKLCKVMQGAPYSSSCEMWKPINRETRPPMGYYYHLTQWPDGHSECGRIEIVVDERRTRSEFGQDVGDFTIERSGKFCGQ